MNKKAQTVGAMIMGLFGVVIAWIMASRMEAGIVLKIISVLVTGVVCYFIAEGISSQ